MTLCASLEIFRWNPSPDLSGLARVAVSVHLCVCAWH